MKNILVVYLTLFFIATEAEAKGHWEAQGGINYSSIRNFDVSWKPGIELGARKVWQKNDWLYWSCGATFYNSNGVLENVTRGREDEKYIYVIYTNIKYTINMISFPVSVQIKYARSKKISPFFEFCPQIDIAISNNSTESLQNRKILDKSGIDEFVFDTKVEYGNDSYVVNSGASLVLGTGLQIKNTSFHVQYKYPFTKIYTIGNYVIDQKQDIFLFLITCSF